MNLEIFYLTCACENNQKNLLQKILLQFFGLLHQLQLFLFDIFGQKCLGSIRDDQGPVLDLDLKTIYLFRSL